MKTQDIAGFCTGCETVGASCCASAKARLQTCDSLTRIVHRQRAIINTQADLIKELESQ